MKTRPDQLFVIGLNHRKTPLELRERWSVSEELLPSLIANLRRVCGLQEAVLLSTCNRLEIYGVALDAPPPAGHLLQAVAEAVCSNKAEADASSAERQAYTFAGEACVHHLFRVASSLDSLVVGETEIVGQVKKAYLQAQVCGATGKILNRLFQTALSVSKQVRTRSGIGRCSTSVGAVALDLAEKIFGENLSHRTVLIIGAGKMSETTLRHLAKRGAKSVLVTNRSFERAQELASQFKGEAIEFAGMLRALAQADIVISSTSAPFPIVLKKDLATAMAVRGNRPLFLIDLAVPRDIDPMVLELDGVYLYNIDQLAEIARLNLEHRQAEAVACEQLVAQQARELSARLVPGTSEESVEKTLTLLLTKATTLCGGERAMPAF